MSTQHRQGDDRPPADPHNVVPAGFLENYPAADTIREALRLAEQETSTTDHDEMPRCPACKSVNITRKCDWRDQPNRREGDCKCQNCGEHFAEPAPSVADENGRQATLSEVSADE
jgi:transposase-like protein